jgi:hypothetical protein
MRWRTHRRVRTGEGAVATWRCGKSTGQTPHCRGILAIGRGSLPHEVCYWCSNLRWYSSCSRETRFTGWGARPVDCVLFRSAAQRHGGVSIDDEATAEPFRFATTQPETVHRAGAGEPVIANQVHQVGLIDWVRANAEETADQLLWNVAYHLQIDSGDLAPERCKLGGRAHRPRVELDTHGVEARARLGVPCRSLRQARSAEQTAVLSVRSSRPRSSASSVPASDWVRLISSISFLASTTSCR